MATYGKDREMFAADKEFLQSKLFRLQESHWPVVVHALRVEGSEYSTQLADQIEQWYRGTYWHATKMIAEGYAFRKQYDE